MSLAETLMRRVVEPSAVRFYQWRGDPVARWMHPKTKANPYALYEEIRPRGFVRSGLGACATVSYATAERILRDRRFSSSPTHQRGYRPPPYPDGDPRAELPDSLLFLDPPDHTRLRRLVSSAFTPRAIADLEAPIRDITGRLLDEAGPAGFDLIETLAFPLPIAVICRLLGVPAEDQDRFRAWGHDVAATLEPQTRRAAESDRRTAELALTAYLQDLVAKRRAEPDDSLLSALIAAEEEGDRLTSAELVSTALLLLVAGFETTVNLIGNGTVALLRDREQWRRLCENPGLIPGAVEELLRYDSPVQASRRITLEPVTVGGVTIPAGAFVMASLGSANRDERFWGPDAAELNLRRENARQHVSFGAGPHHCLGASLARLEACIAFERLTARFPDLALDGDVVWNGRINLRGPAHLPVSAG
jgi:cytochrome P450